MNAVTYRVDWPSPDSCGFEEEHFGTDRQAALRRAIAMSHPSRAGAAYAIAFRGDTDVWHRHYVEGRREYEEWAE